MNRNWVTIIAAVLFVGSLVVCGYSRTSVDPLTEINGPEWTVLDYVALVMFIASLGFSLAVYKLPDDDDEDEDS